MIRLAFSGPAGTGKTFLAKHCESLYGGRVLSFASSLKRWAGDIGWDGLKDEKGRLLLQELGQVVRRCDQDTWVRLALESEGFGVFRGWNGGLSVSCPPHTQNLFVDDLRFPNEADILGLLGFTLVRLLPEGFDLGERWRKDNSETALDDYDHDYYIRSVCGDLDGLKLDIKVVVADLMEGANGGASESAEHES